VSLLDIHVLGSPVLRAVTKPVPAVDAGLQQLIDDMLETMYAAHGIGLAAPQVGRTERVAVVEVDGTRLVLVNPELVWSEGKDIAEEGCLSIPDVFGDVERALRVRVRALDREGKPYEVEAAELLARAIQHEVDHLHGRLFIDHLSFLKRRAALARWDSLKDRYPGFLRKLEPLGSSVPVGEQQQAENL
jgi:peptide deformylase